MQLIYTCVYIYICLPQWPDLRALLLRYWWQPLTASKPNMNIYIRLQCFKRKKTPLPNHQFDSIFECLVVNCPGCTSQTFQLSSVMALNKKSFPLYRGACSRWGFRAPPQVRFATMERQHNALSDELWGDELSLAKVRVFWVRARLPLGFFFLWGELPTKISPRNSKGQTKTQ